MLATCPYISKFKPIPWPHCELGNLCCTLAVCQYFIDLPIGISSKNFELGSRLSIKFEIKLENFNIFSIVLHLITLEYSNLHDATIVISRFKCIYPLSSGFCCWAIPMPHPYIWTGGMKQKGIRIWHAKIEMPTLG